MADGTPARPLSPHLQIWRWSPTMASSITHRATGVALYGGTILLALWFASIAAGRGAYETLSAVLGSPVGLVGLFGFAWSLLFHTLNGLRHLYWDSGRGLDPKTARLTSIALFGASAILAAAIFALALRNAGTF
ncbi:MAG: succinate dehydrogenase, cytochrome b556 subunit [Parvularculaceae bacterium]|jgi:succinate dehydrogenase / fumarate reductase cytochrome b subunit|nr:succinate dehydrogenase, cytochrome b556 subunit [Parvularculaceae bacterium]